MATVAYTLKLSNPSELTITRISFGSVSKSGNSLKSDYDPSIPGYRGTFTGVNSDCSYLFVEIQGDGLNGTTSTLSVDACFGMQTVPSPVVTTTGNGNHGLAKDFQLVEKPA